jgi:hypothetical protein
METTTDPEVTQEQIDEAEAFLAWNMENYDEGHGDETEDE